MLWLALNLPQLALDLVAHTEPDHAAPLAVVEGPAQRRSVHSANTAARAAGVHAGQKQSAAQAICPELSLRARHLDHEHEALHRLAACLYRISAEVSTQPPDGALIEAAASRTLFGGGAGVIDAVRDTLSELALTARIGIAPTPAGAELAARIADGMHALSRQSLMRMVESASLALSGLSESSCALLSGSGLRNLGEVIRLPRDALARRIGRVDMNHLDRLTGACADRRVLYQPPRRFLRRMEMPAPLSNTQSLLFPLKRMLRDLGMFLLSQDAGIQRFEVHFSHEKHADSVLDIGLLHIERDPDALFELMQERLDRFALPAATIELMVRADQLETFAPAQPDLLSDRSDSRDTPERLLERLRARLGDEAVRGIVPHDEHRPELASRACALPWQAREAQALYQRQDSKALHDLMRVMPARPNWLLGTPRPIDDRQLQMLSGPERIESGWWDGADCRRDYYIAQDPQGRRVWVFHTLDAQRAWYLHGVFG